MGKFDKHGGKRKGAGRPPVEDRKVIVGLRLKSSIAGRVTRMLYEGIATGMRPYKNPSQLYEAIILKGLEELVGDSDEVMQYFKATGETQESNRHRKEAHAAFSMTQTELKEIRSSQMRGAEDEACRLYWGVVWNFKAMKPGFWRDWFIRRMKEEYPEYDEREPKRPSLDIDSHNEEYDEKFGSSQSRAARPARSK